MVKEIKLKAPKIEIKGVGGVTIFLPDFLQDIIRDKFGIDLEVGYDGRVLLNKKNKKLNKERQYNTNISIGLNLILIKLKHNLFMKKVKRFQN